MSATTSSINKDGMRIYKNVKSVDVPSVDLLTLLFGTRTTIVHPKARLAQLTNPHPDSEHSIGDEDTPLHFSAANPNVYLTKGALRALSQRIAHFLRHGFAVGAEGPYRDVVVVCTSGQPAAPAMFWGVIAAGGVFSAASPSFTPEELARQIKQGKSKTLVISGDNLEVGKKAAQLAGLSLDRVIVFDSEPAWEVRALAGGQAVDVEKGPRMPWKRVTDADELARSLIVLLYSSGTTGVPKGRPTPSPEDRSRV